MDRSADDNCSSVDLTRRPDRVTYSGNNYDAELAVGAENYFVLAFASVVAFVVAGEADGYNSTAKLLVQIISNF